MATATVEEMVEWFLKNYEDPVHSLPVDGGEYVWIVDGPYDAREELEDHFPKADPADIDAAVKTVEEDCWEWVKLSDWDDFEK